MSEPVTTKQDPNSDHFFESKKEHPDFPGYPDIREKCDCCGLSLRDGKHLAGG